MPVPTIRGGRSALLVDHLGKDKLLTEITGNDVAKLVAWRRGHKRRDGSLISPYTVNDTTEQLKKLFTRAKAWGADSTMSRNGETTG